jgi:ATP-dependent HslUV protease subunit HslV
VTTVVVVRKGRDVAIAADALVTFGDTRLSGVYEQNEKILQVDDSYIGLAGSSAHYPVMRGVLTGLKEEERKLHSREDIFRTFSRVHAILKDQYFLNPKEEDDDPYESSHITCLIANPSGIYGVYSYREVFAFERFWGIGSGRNFALGAMYAAYDRVRTAKDVALMGVKAGAEFDKNSSEPFRLFTLKVKR